MQSNKSMESKSLGKKTLSGFIWLFSGSSVQIVFQFVVTLILARLLDPIEFGIISSATVVVSLGTIISMLGVGPALIQRDGLNESHVTTAYYFSIFLNTVLAILIFNLSEHLANFLNVRELASVLELLSIVFFIQGFSVVAEALMKRNLKFKKLAVIQIISFFCYGVIAISLALTGFGYWAMVAAVIAQYITKSILLLVMQKHTKALAISFKSLKELLLYGTGFSLGRVSNYFALQGDNIVVSRYLGAEFLGFYSRAYQLVTMPANLLGQVLSDVLFTVMSRMQNELDSLAEYYKRITSIMAVCILPITVVITLIADNIIEVLYGSNWLVMTTTLQILAAGMIFRTSGKISDAVIKATGAVYRRAWRQLVYAIFVIGGALIGSYWGIEGVAVGILLALSINYVMLSQLTLKLLKIGWKDILQIHFAGIRLLAVFLSSIYIADLWLSSWTSNSFMIVGSILLVSLIVVIVCFFVFPRWTFGEENVRVILMMKDFVLSKVKKSTTNLK